jgi:hypothetical protein
VGGALLDDVGCAERGGTRDRDDNSERLIHDESMPPGLGRRVA